MQKEKGYFLSYIESKKEMIEEIKLNRNFTELQKDELIKEYKADIERLQRLELKATIDEVRRTKQTQYSQIR